MDINRHHLALTSLKINAARNASTYGEFYDLCGRGWSPDPVEVVTRLTRTSTPWIREYWQRNSALFERNFYREGITAQVINYFRRLAGIDSQWLRETLQMTAEDRTQAMKSALSRIFANPLLTLWLNSPLQLMSFGINHTQRDRILLTESLPDMSAFIQAFADRFIQTDLKKSWFAWYIATGNFSHETEDAVPPYLRRKAFEGSRQGRAPVTYHHGNIFERLAQASRRTWTHYSFCDAPDWMGQETREQLASEVLRTADDGAKVLLRSVEVDPWLESTKVGRHFKLVEPASTQAALADRTRQYRRVDLYEVSL